MRTILPCLALALAATASPTVRAEEPAARVSTPEAGPAAAVPSGPAALPAAAATGAGAPPTALDVPAVARAIDPSSATSLATAVDPTLAASTAPATADPALAGSIAPTLAGPALSASIAPATAPEPRGAVAATNARPAPAEASDPARLPRFGVALGGGFPEFATLNLLYRPFRFLRVSAGPTWNYVGFGGNVGVTLVPVNWWITPLLGFDAGHYLRGDYSKLVKSDSSDSASMKPLLRRVDYDYTAADLGLEFGSPSGFSVTLRFGLTWVWVTANGTGTKTTDSGTTLSATNASLRATLPSAKLGFQYWF